jgi:hypothetical protein
MSATSRMPPPHRVHAPAGLTADDALGRLSAYLEAAEQQPHLHPDARLTVSGVEFNTAGAAGGVVLHNLRRLQAGLRGELLQPEPDPELEADVEMADAEPAGDDARLDAQIAARAFAAQEGREEEEEAGDEIGELGDRSNAVDGDGTVPQIQKTVVDKEQRKKDKKARRKAEKAQSAEEQQDVKEKKKRKGKKNASS